MSRENTLKRLGAVTGACSWCECTMLLILPEAGVDIAERHWHVAIGLRSMPLHVNTSRNIACSKGCAEELARAARAAFGRKPRTRITVHGPYTPHEP